MKVSVPHPEEIPDTSPWSVTSAATGQRADASQRFEFVDVGQEYQRSDVQAAWRHLLATRRSPERLYQLPAFFDYLMETSPAGGAACHLHLVRRRSDARIVGVVPGRKTTQTVNVRLGPLTLFTRTVPVYQVLGSLPLLDAGEEDLGGFVLKSLLQNYPDCRALLLQAVPAELAGAIGGNGLSSHVMQGWRDCHTVPLPADVETYLQKLSAKKRYNLSRQVRLLSKEAGEVALVPVEHAHQVAALTEAIQNLHGAEDFVVQNSQAKLESLARHGLLHSYLLQCGGRTIALVLGTRSDEVWHVHNIFCDPAYASLSVGTSVVHLALQDAIASSHFIHADFGYGTPNQEFRSTHVLQRRGKLLLCRSRSMTGLMFRLHGIQDRMNEALIGYVKTLRKRQKERKRASKQVSK